MAERLIYTDVVKNDGGEYLSDLSLQSRSETLQERAVAEFLATEALAKFWDGVYPVDARGIAVRMGMRVLFTDSLKRSTAGMILWPSDQEAPTTFINQDLSSPQRRFVIAHEIGHYVEHMPKRLVGDDAPFGYEDSIDLFASRTPIKSGKSDRRECVIFADSFAYALLVPEWELRSLVNLGGTVNQLSEYFAIPENVLLTRLSVTYSSSSLT